jgi:hypothetical protein
MTNGITHITALLKTNYFNDVKNKRNTDYKMINNINGASRGN